MFVTVFPPLVDVVLTVVALGIVSFWTGVVLFAGVGRLVDHIAPNPFDPTVPVELASPSVFVGAFEGEVAS